MVETTLVTASVEVVAPIIGRQTQELTFGSAEEMHEKLPGAKVGDVIYVDQERYEITSIFSHGISLERAPLEKEPERPAQSKGIRRIDLTTHDEKYLCQRVLDLEYVIKDLLGPVSPGKEVHPGRRLIEGWFYPWRLEAACKVLHGKRANEVYTRAKGDVDSEHADGRRRAL